MSRIYRALTDPQDSIQDEKTLNVTGSFFFFTCKQESVDPKKKKNSKKLQN